MEEGFGLMYSFVSSSGMHFYTNTLTNNDYNVTFFSESSEAGELFVSDMETTKINWKTIEERVSYFKSGYLYSLITADHDNKAIQVVLHPVK